MTVSITSRSVKSSFRALIWAGLILTPTASLAEEVALKSKDGRVNLFGELIEFSGEHYVIKSAMGEMNVQADAFDCEGAACPFIKANTGALKIAGSDTIGEELMPLLLSGLAEAKGAVVKKNPLEPTLTALDMIGNEGKGDPLLNAIVEFKGSSTAFAALADGSAEIGMSSRPAKPEEVALFKDTGLGDLEDIAQEHAFAVDGLLVVVHPDLPIDALKQDEISGLLSGRIGNWAEVGGPDLPVTVFSRNSNSGTFSTVNEALLKPNGETITPAAVVLEGSAEVSEAVYTTPGAIGFVGFAFKGDAKALGIASSCGVVSTPTTFSAKTGEYVLNRKLFLYNSSRPLSDDAAKLISFASSPGAYPFIEKAGFLSYAPEQQHQDEMAEMIKAAIKTTNSRSEATLMRELYIDMTEWDRLSTTFRFKTGSTALDNASLEDLHRLMDFIRSNEELEEIAFVGFTDADGPFEANRVLGLNRAEVIEDIVYEQMEDEGLDTSGISVKSFGELNPVACNDDFAGQQMNRRVEIWVKRHPH